MTIDRIYLGTWLPRTHTHLAEMYHFLQTASAPDLDKNKIKNLHERLRVEDLHYNNNEDFDNIRFISDGVAVTITEDGVISLMIDKVSNIESGVRKIESFYIERLGPALSYLFSRGAPLPQTLIDIKEVYPKIFVGKNISQDEVKKIFDSQNDSLLSQITSDNLGIFYGEETEVIETPDFGTNALYDSFITNLIFTQSYSDLLRRYLVAHRSVWSEISLLREARDLRHRDFPAIRNKILNFLKTISFIQTRIKQMNEILLARSTVTPEIVKQKLVNLGLESFKVLESSSRYFSNLWQMTADYAQSTLMLFESLVTENTQREIRLLQKITVAGMLVGFFGMNIAFPWEERWQDTFLSSFLVIGVIILGISIFNQIFKRVIGNRRFVILNDTERNSK